MPVGTVTVGVVSNITDYGAFVRIEEGVEGLVHVSEMAWGNANSRPEKVVRVGQKVNVSVLDIQESKHRISLSMKQAMDNPWHAFDKNHETGDKISVVIKSITDFGLFVGLPGGIDGLIHLGDVMWEKPTGYELVDNFTKGQEIEVVIVNIDTSKERVSLGIKQLEEDAFGTYISSNGKGSFVKGEAIEVNGSGVVVELAEGVSGFLKSSEISQSRDGTAALKPGMEIESVIINIDKRARQISLSMKAKDDFEEKEVMSDYNKQSSDQVIGSTLGDLLAEIKRQD